MPLSIIYLDDEPDICQIFADAFAGEDISVATYTDAEAAVSAITQRRPDLVFLDYRLRNTTGDVVAARLDPAIPKVLISGDLNVPQTTKFVRVFPKPFDIHKITRFLRGYLKPQGA